MNNNFVQDALDTIHSWLVCYPITSVEDMAQSFPAMERLARKALSTASEPAGVDRCYQHWLDLGQNYELGKFAVTPVAFRAGYAYGRGDS